MVRTLGVMLPLLIAATSAAANPAAPVKAKTNPDKKICKADAQTGSRVGKRTCRTAGEWESSWKAGSQEARQLIDSIRSSGTNY